jgi:hypothetical protein
MKRLLLLAAAVAVAGSFCGWAIASLPLFSPPKQLVQFGYVASVTQKGRDYVLRFDPALWLTGETANVAAAEDGAIRPGEPVPNDYWIRNPDHRLLTYKLPAGAHVTILRSLETTKVSVATLARLLKTKPRNACAGRYQLHPPCRLGFWMRYSIDTVKALDQQYQP